MTCECKTPLAGMVKETKHRWHLVKVKSKRTFSITILRLISRRIESCHRRDSRVIMCWVSRTRNWTTISWGPGSTSMAKTTQSGMSTKMLATMNSQSSRTSLRSTLGCVRIASELYQVRRASRIRIGNLSKSQILFSGHRDMVAKSLLFSSKSQTIKQSRLTKDSSKTHWAPKPIPRA